MRDLRPNVMPQRHSHSGCAVLRPLPSAGSPAVRLSGSRLRRACSAPPVWRLGYIRRTAFYVCVTKSESRFHVCRKRVRNSVPNPPNLFRTFRTFSYSSLLSGGPLNGPPRQVVKAGRRHNCRPSRQSGGCAPRPPLMPKGSGFGVRDSRGETQYSEPCGFGMSPLSPSRSQLFSMFGPAGQKKWEPYGSQIKVKESDACAPSLFWQRRSSTVDQIDHRPRHGRFAPFDEGLRGPHAPASSASRRCLRECHTYRI